MSLGRLLLLSIFQVSWCPLYSVMQNSESEISPFYKCGGESETLPPPSSSFQPPHVSLTPDTLAPFLFFLNKPSTCVPRARRAPDLLAEELIKGTPSVLKKSARWPAHPLSSLFMFLTLHQTDCSCLVCTFVLLSFPSPKSMQSSLPAAETWLCPCQGLLDPRWPSPRWYGSRAYEQHRARVLWILLSKDKVVAISWQRERLGKKILQIILL